MTLLYMLYNKGNNYIAGSLPNAETVPFKPPITYILDIFSNCQHVVYML